jgi:hypothetical protein
VAVKDHGKALAEGKRNQVALTLKASSPLTAAASNSYCGGEL